MKRVILTFLFMILFLGVGCINEKETKDNSIGNSSEVEVKNGDRVFISNITPSNEWERVILEALKVQITDRYENFKNLYVTREDFNYLLEVYKNNIDRGIFETEIIVNWMKEINKEQYIDLINKNKNYKQIEEIDLLELENFHIIEVNYSNKVTKKVSEEKAGTWIKYFVMIKEENKTWKIFDVYSDD